MKEFYRKSEELMYKVVLVDDEYWALQANIQIFNWEKFGFSVAASTTDAEEAIELITKHKPEVVFLDINMPGMSGFELIEKLNNSDKIKFVIISAYREFEFAQKAIGLEVFDYCIKPIRRETADTVLERLKKKLDKDKNGFDVESELSKYNFRCENIKNKKFRELLEYVLVNYSFKFNLNNLAEEYSLNPNYCSSLFMKYFDCGFSEFVSKIKIYNAAIFLKNTDMKIEDIALDKCGFSDYGYFNKVFKKFMNVSPSEYRKNNL